MLIDIAQRKDGGMISLHSEMVTRHGFITGATGTGKTVTLKGLAEKMAKAGSSVFLIDVKGDLNSFGRAGECTDKLNSFQEKHNLAVPDFRSFKTIFWDIFGTAGMPVRTTVSDLGPALMAKLLELNNNQTNLLHTIYQIADDEGLLLLDYKDLTELVKYLYENNKSFEEAYGTLNKQSMGAIQRALVAMNHMEVDEFFGERALELSDLIATPGTINVMAAQKLILNEKLYSTFLLWLLSELYESLPEIGDVEVPKLVLFFDEAHLIFKGISKVLLNKMEQVIKLIRSKGVAVFFISQRPTDIPDEIMAQLGNKIQHGIRMKDAKNPMENSDKLLKFGVGEVCISLLDGDGVALPYEEAVVLPPASWIGKTDDCDYYSNRSLADKYGERIDRVSAYEMLTKRSTSNRETAGSTKRSTSSKTKSKGGRKKDSFGTKVAKSLLSSFGRSLGSGLARGLMGTLKRY